MDERTDTWEYPYPNAPQPFTSSGNDTTEVKVWAQEARDPEALKALLNFSVNNRDLDKLESLIGAFNPLKVLGVSDFEIRHSNVLSWLIDPAGHHGLGDSLFKKILLEILKDNNGYGFPQIENIISASFADLRVLREWRNIDICAVSPLNNLVMVIENKIGSEETGQQLVKYVDIVDKKYPRHFKVYVLLSLDGVAPKGSDRYISFTHEQIHEIVRSTVEIRRDYMNAKVYDFIQQYLHILEEKTMQSAEFIDICGKLYREHKDAIKMIMTYGKPKLPINNIQDFHSRTKTESVYMDKDSVRVYYPFLPITWTGIVPTTNKYTQDKYLVFFMLNLSDYENHKITLTLNIGNFPDPEERSRFVDTVDKASAADKNNKLTIRKLSKTNTIILSKSISLKDDGGGDYDLDDYQAITDKLIETYNSDDIQQAFQILDGVIQKFEFKDAKK